MRESYTAILAKVEERLKNLIEINMSDHKEIISDIKNLTEHVNHENECMAKRITALEEHEKINKATSRTLKKVVTGIAGLIGLILVILGILEYFGIGV